MMLLAQIGAYSLVQWLILAMVIAGIIGVVFVIIRATGVAIPGWIIQVGWIVLAVLIGVVAVKFLASML